MNRKYRRWEDNRTSRGCCYQYRRSSQTRTELRDIQWTGYFPLKAKGIHNTSDTPVVLLVYGVDWRKARRKELCEYRIWIRPPAHFCDR